MSLASAAGSVAASWARSEALAKALAFLRRIAAWLAAASRRSVRRTAIVTVILVCACFAAATVLQMRRDYASSLAMAEAYTGAQSQTFAAETARALNRLAALGTAYIAAVDEQTAQGIVTASEKGRVLNIALADADGRFITAMKGRALQARPLPEIALERARVAPSVAGFADPAIGSSPLTLVFKADNEIPPRFIVMPLDPLALLPSRALGESALFASSGETLALGEGWEEAPPPSALRAESGPAVRYLDLDGERRIIVLTPVPGWPIAAAASVKASDALGAWYGSLPLYLFVIIGPAIAGAVLAFLLVREFERADRARMALVNVKAINETRAPTPSERELLARVAESEKRARDADRSKAEFIAHMSHELRTPLNAIIGFSEIIHTGMFGPAGQPKYVEYAGDIGKAGRALHERIGEILDYAAADVEGPDLACEPFDVNALVLATAEAARKSALARDIAFRTELGNCGSANADASSVKRILTVLVSNAVRYTKDGGSICVETRREEDTIVLLVKDSGVGISEDEQARLGAPFVRFARPRKDGDDGSGLGIGVAMAMTLARRMGGALRLNGAAGEGTWAELRLPA